MAAICDIVAYTEVYNESVCLLTIDFKEAFDRISHSYLYTILREYGFSEEFCKQIQGLYANVTSTLNINGNRSQLIPIQSSVRQGCPLSMTLFALCLNPLLNTLEKKLTGVKIGRRGTKTMVITYADDVTIVVSKPEDIPIVHTKKIRKSNWGKNQHPKIEGHCSWLMEHILEDTGHTILNRNEGAGTSYTEYHTRLSEKELEYADLTDSSTGSHVPTGTRLGPKNTICTGIPFGKSMVYGTNPPTTERQPEANQHDYLMVFMER